MRLTCPNCKAQYEIDGAAVPETGRDVQCSACGTTWFQYPDTVSAQPDALTDEDAETGLPSDADLPEAAPAGGIPAGGAKRVDQSVLAVLREEAARELTERKRDNAGGLETQGDLGLVTRPRPAASTPGTAAEGKTQDATPETPAPSRRNLLPDIEELSSTLQPGSAPRRTGNFETALPPIDQDEATGFRQGLSVVLLVAMLLVGLYVLAPIIAQYVPALADPLAGYVGLADSLRAWVADSLRGLFARISGMG